MKLPEISVKRPVATIMLFLAVLLFGVVSLLRLPLDVLPEMELPTLTVITVYPGAAADEVEQQVTRQLEGILSGTEHLKEITSQSKENVSFVALQFDWGTDVTAAANNARDLIELVKNKLPNDARNPIIFKVNSSMMPVLVYGITATQSYDALDQIIENDIASPIRKVAGVGTALVLGTPTREIQVNIDPQKLKAYHLSIAQISTILKAENISIPGGNLKVGDNDFAVRVPGEIKEVDQLREIALVNFNGTIIRLKDVAGIDDGFEEKDSYSRTLSGQGAAFMVQKQSGENTLEVVKGVRAKIDEVQKKLPKDVKIQEVMNADELITESVSSLSSSLWYALFFVVLVVLAFLRDWRQGFIVFLTIPFSLITAFIMMFMVGWTINIFSLMSLIIAIGMVVDNAIVVLENITQHIEKGARPLQAAIFGTSEMGQAITASILTTLMVFLPMVFMGGIVGILFKQLALLTAITLIASLFTAMTLTPMVSSKMMRASREKDKKRHGNLYEWSEKPFLFLEGIYKTTLGWAVHHKSVTAVLTLLLFVVTLWMGRWIGSDYIPEFDAGDVAAVIETEVGTSAEKTDSVARVVMNIFKEEIPELTEGSLAAISGQTEDGTLSTVGFSEGKNISTILGHLTLPNKRDRSAKEISEVISARIEQIPEVINFHVTGGSVLSAAVTGNKKPVEINIYGKEFGEINPLAQDITTRLEQVGGFSNVSNTVDDGKLEVQVNIDKRKASSMGLNAAMIGLQIRQSIYGAEAGEFKDGGEEFTIMVRYASNSRSGIEQVKNIMLTNLLGNQVPLVSVAEVTTGTGALQINRFAQQRVVKVMAELNAVSLGDARVKAEQIIASLDVPDGVEVELAGQTSDQGESFGELYLILFIGIALVYMVMAGQFESFRDPFIIMFAIPLTFTGVILAFLLTGLTLSVTTFIGVIMLMGIVVNNGIVLVDYTNLLRKRGLNLYEAVQEAGRSRLRPVLMTSLTTILGMLPMALSRGMGRELYSPLGVTMIGGLLGSTVITLLVVPTFYAILHRREQVTTETI